MRDWSRKRLLRGSLTRKLRSLKTMTESRLLITLSVRMMANENKMLLSTTQWRYRYLVACVFQIDQNRVPLLVSLFLCVRFTMDSLHLFHYKKKEKESSYQLGFRFALTRKEGILQELCSRSQKTEKSRKKNAKEKESKGGFYRSDIVCNLLIE